MSGATQSARGSYGGNHHSQPAPSAGARPTGLEREAFNSAIRCASFEIRCSEDRRPSPACRRNQVDSYREPSPGTRVRFLTASAVVPRTNIEVIEGAITCRTFFASCFSSSQSSPDAEPTVGSDLLSRRNSCKSSTRPATGEAASRPLGMRLPPTAPPASIKSCCKGAALLTRQHGRRCRVSANSH